MKNQLPEIILTLCLVAHSGAYAKSPGSLKSDLLRTMELSPRVKAALEGVNVERERHNQAFGRYLPSITIQGNMSRQQLQQSDSADMNTIGDRRYYSSNNSVLNVSQVIFNRRISGEISLAEMKIGLAEIKLELERQSQFEGLLKNVSSYISSRHRVQTLTEEKAYLSNLLDSVRSELAVGMATKIEVSDVESRLSLVWADLEGAIMDLKSAELLYFQKIKQERDVDLALPLDIAEDVVNNLPVPALGQFMERVLSGNSQLAKLRLEADIAEKEVSNATTDHFPTVTSSVQIYESRSDNAYFLNSQSKGALVGVQLNIPIYSGGAMSARAREMVAIKAQADLQLDDAIDQVKYDSFKAHHALTTHANRVEAIKISINSQRQNIDGIERGKAAGLKKLSDLLDARVNLLKQVTTLRESQLEYFMAFVRCELLQGSSLATLATTIDASVLYNSQTAKGVSPISY
ncbi:hypothetical protein GH816_02960 [Betaproteobacteria bacterium LSUCC0115]|nr:hypothetical protein [Burkholderiales bacterium LSUCC0115]